MKLLFISHTFPFPPNEGTKLAVYNLVKEFAKLHYVDLLSFIEVNEKQYISEISKFCKIYLVEKNFNKGFLHRILLTFLNKLPYNVIQFFDKRFYRILDELLLKNQYDIVLFSFLTTSYYSSFFAKRVPFILHYYDAMSMLFYRNFLNEKKLFKKFYWYFQYKKLLKYEN
ncbi:MAG: hypothetical protein QXO21_05815, partial [Candidatus Anstonellales archaeon]